MATIKLQPSGNVVIKDGKVSCGCCEVCGCSSILLPSNLFETLKNATSFIVFGEQSFEFLPNPEPPFDFLLWQMRWTGGGVPGFPGSLYQNNAWLHKNGCLLFSSVYSCNSVDADFVSLASAGNPFDCGGEFTFDTGTFSINGEGEFPYFITDYISGIFCYPPSAPNLIFV